jgi:predicted amidohydrolase
MIQPLRVSLVQTDVIWHEPEKNREKIAKKLVNLKGETDLVVLPEMFTSGFTVEPDSDITDSAAPTLTWMQEQANTLDAAICGSTVFHNGTANTNRMWFVTPNAEPIYYDKVHLFRMADEHKRYAPGNQRTCVTYKGWRILLTICYDLRFPVFCRNQNDYDAMICVASWPAPRRHPWRSLLMARAIENSSYVIGVNRVGEDGKGWEFSGDSMLINHRGDTLIDHPINEEFMETGVLDYQALEAFREKFPVWMDADDFDITLKQ